MPTFNSLAHNILLAACRFIGSKEVAKQQPVTHRPQHRRKQ